MDKRESTCRLTFSLMMALLFAIVTFSSCNVAEDLADDSIPETSIFSPLSTARLAAISIREPLFASMYNSLHSHGVHSASQEVRDAYPSVTYASLYEVYRLGSDVTDECRELTRRFEDEWDAHPELHPLYDSMADFIAQKCADFAAANFALEVAFFKTVTIDVWESIIDVWRTMFTF